MMSSIKTVRIEIYIVGHAEFKKIGVYLISLTIILENLVKLLLINLKIILKKCTVQVFIPKAGIPLMIMIGYLRASIVR